MLRKITELVEALNNGGIRYCHWKSNCALGETVSGQTDIDLLVHRKDANAFRMMVSQLCFKPALATDGESLPSIEHYFALDEESGVLAHVHVYFRVITGESLTKNYRFPIEEMLLGNTREVGSLRVPAKGAELVVFTLRIMLKHTALVELVLLSRYWRQVQEEIKWLIESNSTREALKYVEGWLPSVDTDLFYDCVTAIRSPAPLLRRVMLGHRLRSQLCLYARHSRIAASLAGILKFTKMCFRRMIRSEKGMIGRGGGAVIAFVGPEASGKSTVLGEMRKWLAESFAVKQIHAGKPRSTILSFAPNLLVPGLRSILPRYRSTHLEGRYAGQHQSEKAGQNYAMLFAIRSVLLAYDRRSLLSRAFARAANGTIVLCDRYPSLQSGAPDSPQLSHLPVAANGYSVRRLLAEIEARFYREIPPPDLVIYLSAPLEITLARNAARGKREPEEYVRRRHARSSNLEFEKTPICEINTDQPIDQTIAEVKRAVWNAL